VDVGHEPASTWEHVRTVLRPRLAAAGCQLEIVRTADWMPNEPVDRLGRVLLPLFFRRPDGSVGKLPTLCSGRWKAEVCRRWLRSRGIMRCSVWLGMSADESRRAKPSQEPWCHRRWPLIEMKLTRERCGAIVREAGWPEAPRTSCVFCPQHSQSEWCDLARSDPAAFSHACETEQQIQSHARAGNFFLHRAAIPLRDAISAEPGPQACEGPANCRNCLFCCHPPT